mmetsp:Transcript_110427/g.352060  ORF Transcript_110427/g.352060 Transcript_110427/m.352060 type:complete len:200 (-) Transcript_110427:58-657(-)
MRLVEVAMGSDQFVLWQPRLALQGVYILGVAAQQDAFVMQQLDEEVRRCRIVRPGPHLPGQLVEGSRATLEECDVKHGLGSRQVEALQVVVEPSAWSPKVGDACRSGYASSTHHDNLFALLLCNVPRDTIQIKGLQDAVPLLLIRIPPLPLADLLGDLQRVDASVSRKLPHDLQQLKRNACGFQFVDALLRGRVQRQLR